MASIARHIPRFELTAIRDRWELWWENFHPTPLQKRLAGIAGMVLLGLLWGVVVSYTGVTALLLCLSIFACIFTLLDFRAGVALLIVLMPISQSYLFPHEMFGITGINPLNVLVAATLGSLYMRWLGHGMLKGFVPRTLFLLYAAPMLMGACLGMFHWEEIPSIFHDLDMLAVTSTPTYWRDMFLKPFMFVVYALVISCAVQKSERPERFLLPMFISIVVMAVIGIGFVLFEGYSLSQLAGVYSRQMFSSLGMHANDLGRLYATAYAPLLFIWGRTSSSSLKFFLVIAMMLVAAALLVTFSRGAFLSFILVNIIFLASRRSAKLYLLAAVLVPIALVMAPGALWDRVSMGVGQGANAVTAGRSDDIWAPLFPELLDSPFWGKGLGSVMWSRAMTEGRLPAISHPHNAYLQAYMDMGLIGLLLLLAFWIYIWARCLRYGKDRRLPVNLQAFFQGTAAGILAFLVAGFAGSSLEPDAAQVFMWLGVGMMYGVARRLAIKIS
ncbi:MAG TPA: O-antigen ligase family protein [Usitatibacter sp.]|jgi:O-antigen ligase|nr:O-antigen ligase family protein [Usitatibacter sp.]